MKRVLLSFGLVGAILLSSCEKEESVQPAEKVLIKADKGILCRGCGQWDIVDPESDESSSARLATYDGETDTVSAPVAPIKPRKKK